MSYNLLDPEAEGKSQDMRFVKPIAYRIHCVVFELCFITSPRTLKAYKHPCKQTHLEQGEHSELIFELYSLAACIKTVYYLYIYFKICICRCKNKVQPPYPTPTP